MYSLNRRVLEATRVILPGTLNAFVFEHWKLNGILPFCHSNTYKIKYILKLQLGTNESDKNWCFVV